MSRHETGNTPPEDAQTPPDDNQIIAERRAKLKALRTEGNAYPNDFRRDALAAELHDAHDAKTAEELEAATNIVAVAGRMLLKRVMGKASFATLQDMSERIPPVVNVEDRRHAEFTEDEINEVLRKTGFRGLLPKQRSPETQS